MKKTNRMNPVNNKEKLRRSRVAFFVNLPICVLSMFTVFKAIDSQSLWRITASSIGFIVFLSFTILSFKQMIRLTKLD